MRIKSIYIFSFLLMLLCVSPAFASYFPSATSNVGIGTTQPVYGKLVVANGNLGVGSFAPGKALDVTGTVRADYFIGNGSGLTGLNSSQWTTINTNDVYLPNSGNIGVGTTFTTTSAMTIMNGNVGIGTWLPSAALTVGSNAVTINNAGAITSSGTLTAANIILSSGAFRTNADTGSVLLYGGGTSKQGGQINFYGGTNTTFPGVISFLSGTAAGPQPERMRIDANGNVGIGSWAVNTFSNKLSIVGNVGIGTGYSSDYINTAASNGGLIVEGNVGIGSLIPGKKLDVTGTVRANYFIGDGSGLTGISSSQWATQNSTDVSLAGGNVGIGTTKTTTSALTVMNGNVGIGTWIPAFNLDLTGSERLTGGLTVGGAVAATGAISTGGNITWTSNANGRIYNNNSGAGINVILAGGEGSDSILYLQPTLTANATSGAVIVRVGNAGGTEALRAIASGNVGINTGNPGTRLDIIGTVRATGFTGDGSGLTNISAANWTASGSDVYEGSGNVGIGTSKLTTSALTVMSGNVGIGTWKPAYLLDVNGAGNLNGALNINYTASSGPSLSVVGGGNGDNLVTITRTVGGDGSIGFNVHNTNPQVDFAVAGQGSSASWDVGVLDNDADQFSIGYETGGNYLDASSKILTMTTGGNVGLGTTFPLAGLSVMNGNVGIGTWVVDSARLIVSGGNVGIGSIRPGKALDVFGTVRANYFIGDGSGLTGISSGSSQFTTINTNDVYLPNSGNIGIGTSATTTSALTVMNGNVGIGTWKPSRTLTVKGPAYIDGLTSTALQVHVASQSPNIIDFYNDTFNSGTPAGSFFVLNSGDVTFGANTNSNLTFYTNNLYTNPQVAILGNNVGIGTTGAYNLGIGTMFPQASLVVKSGNVGIGTWVADSGSLIIASGAGNVGIGTIRPGKSLDVIGTVRANYFVGDGSGITGISTANWTASGSDVYQSSGNVGIGTNKLTTAAFTVMNGNVGIGTWKPTGIVEIRGGNVGIGTAADRITVRVGNQLVFGYEYDNGSQNASFGIDWNNGNKQKVTIANTNLTLTFTAPSGPSNLVLKVVQDGNGSRTITTWSGGSGVKWPSGTLPTLSTAASAIDIISCYYDGAYYFCSASLNFQ